MPKQFELCRVCKRNHNQGRGHRYSVSHKRSLELLLSKLLCKIKDIQHFVKNPVPRTGRTQQESKFWCDSCEQEITEQQSLFVRAQTIKHLASEEHTANFERFLAEHGGDVSKHLYCIEAAEFSRWEASCKKMEASLETSGPSSDSKNIIDSDTRSIRVTPENGVRELALSSAPVSALSRICDPMSKPVEGNVHTGAPPPWQRQNVRERDEALISAVSDSSPALFLSRTQERKLARSRNPNRVGAAWAERRWAELERKQRGESAGDNASDASSWLPSFGRVWQSGSRRDSRKEFEAEKRRAKRGRSSAQNSTTFKPAELKPYISKRQRMTMENTEN